MSQLQEKGPEPEPAVVHMPVDAVGEEATGAPSSPVPLSVNAGVTGKRKGPDKPSKPPSVDELAKQSKGNAQAALKKYGGPGRNDRGTFNDNVEERPARSRASERLPQLVKHVSEILVVLSKGYEIECMWLRGTLVIAGNDGQQFTTLQRRVAQGVKNSAIAGDAAMLRQLIALATPGAEGRLAKTVAKLRNLEEGVRGRGWDQEEESDADQAEAALLDRVLRANPLPDDHLSVEGAIEELKKGADERAGVIYLYDGKLHAEQQLVQVLSLSPFAGEKATIRGSKRPCYGCYLALTYARKFQGCDQLDHGVRPGGLWLKAVDTATAHIRALPGTKGPPEAALAWVDAQLRAFDHQRQHKSRLKSGRVVADEDSESDSEGEDDRGGPEAATTTTTS